MKIIKESVELHEEEIPVENNLEQFIGKPLKDFLRTIDGRTKVKVSSENGYATGSQGDKVSGMGGLAHDIGWYMADIPVKSIDVPEDKRFYDYDIMIESYDKVNESILCESKYSTLYNTLYEKIATFLYEKLNETFLDNLAIEAGSKIPEYDPDWLNESMIYTNIASIEYAKALAGQFLYNMPKDEMFESLLTEKKWEHQLPSGSELRYAIEAEDYTQIKNMLKKAFTEVHEINPDDYDEDELEWDLEDIEMLDTEPSEFDGFEEDEDDLADQYDYYLDKLYNLCDALSIWIPFDEEM